jgi:catechol 2,3-dioxygenase-like lactoylglutathione lyase family enzyme
MSEAKARLVGMNHVALEVGDIDEALAFYGRIFAFELRGRSERIAFIDMGDQFLNFSLGRTQAADAERHFGLVVDDKARVRARLAELDIELLPGGGIDFLDPWGNRIQIVDYREIQYTKTPEILSWMKLDGLEKTDAAEAEIEAKFGRG